MSTPNPCLIFNEIPTGYPVPGQTTKYDDTATIDLDNVEVPQGSILVKTVHLSVDPYFRGRMRDASIPSYVPAFPLGKPLVGHGVAEVLRSSAENVKVGDRVYGIFPFQHYSILDTTNPYLPVRVLENKENLPWSVYIGAAGMPGLTAFAGWKVIKEMRPESTPKSVFVSTGAGVVGSIVCQIAKAEGLKVIASTGSDDKVEFLKHIGVDVPFNYKKTSVAEVLKENPIDIYWDNVGGETLDAAIDGMNNGGTILVCGQASQYNTSEPYRIQNMVKVLTKRLIIRGIIVGELGPKYAADFYATFPKMIQDGQIKYTEHVEKGLKNADKLLLQVLKGENTGKAVVDIWG